MSAMELTRFNESFALCNLQSFYTMDKISLLDGISIYFPYMDQKFINAMSFNVDLNAKFNQNLLFVFCFFEQCVLLQTAYCLLLNLP